jgi:type IV pilus assembly protein PilX
MNIEPVNRIEPLGLGGQQGVTLIVVLLILLVTTVLGIAAARIAMLGERSTRYDRDFQVAMQGAEAALIDAELDIRDSAGARGANFVETNTGGFVSGCGATGETQGLCSSDSGAAPIWRPPFDFTGPNAVPFGTFTGHQFAFGGVGVQPARKPSYIIETVPDTRPGLQVGGQALMYRITAVGFGPREDVQVMLQTAFKKDKK